MRILEFDPEFAVAESPKQNLAETRRLGSGFYRNRLVPFAIAFAARHLRKRCGDSDAPACAPNDTALMCRQGRGRRSRWSCPRKLERAEP